MFPVKDKNIEPSLPCGPQLLGLLGQIEADIEYELRPQLVQAESMEPVAFARAFVNLRDLKDRIDAAQKKVSGLYEEWKTVKVPEKFEQNGIPNINLDEGFRVGVSHRVFASVNKDKKDAAYAWLRENDLGDLITETVNTSTLSAVAKSMAEENKELEPSLFNISVVNNTSVTKTK
jgi:hypothetical protein